MPFGNLRWPNLGPSLLKGTLLAQGIPCDVAYFNFDFAERVGLQRYYWIADRFAFVLGGERLFARHCFGDRLPMDDRYWREVLLAADDGLTEQDRRDYEAMADAVGPFLDHCADAVEWRQYALVGFAASFQQTMPSMCLARRIKERCPGATIVFGGAACEGAMGVEILRQFPDVDYVFLGEADLTFPPVVEQILAGGPVELPPGVVGKDSLSLWERAGVRGERESQADPERPVAAATSNCPHPHPLSRRAGEGSCVEPGRFLVDDLDALPYPDFDDYFARWERSPLREEIEPLLFFETSRGCWWGQKHHCKFCGLNGATLTYRSKSPPRAVDELKHLVERYGVHRACSADNIFDYRYFDTFLPLLKQSGSDLAFVYELKPNLRKEQAEALLSAGLGAAQLGIETFSTPILKLIGKGATALQNLQALKWFSAAGIEVKWNILYGFPGEPPEEYAALAELLPSLYHLAPPLAVGRVRMDRFSPYFEEPEANGMVNPRPHRAFPFVYPFPDESLRQLAYYYEFDFADGRDPESYAAEMLEAAEEWQRLKGSVSLRQFDRGDGVLILTDTRPCAATLQRRLTGWQRDVYLFCDAGRTFERICEFTGTLPADPLPETPTIQNTLDEKYLSLALPAP